MRLSASLERPQPTAVSNVRSFIVAHLCPVEHPFAQTLLIVASSIEAPRRMLRRLSGTVSCNRARRCSQTVDQRGLAKTRSQSSHQAQHGHPISPYSMISRTEFGDLLYYTFRSLPLREQCNDVFGLDQSDVLLKAPTQ